jgi:hypothetical protein
MERQVKNWIEWMRKRGLEPLRGNPHYHLKVARIPIPPLSLTLKKGIITLFPVSKQPDFGVVESMTHPHKPIPLF